MSSAWGEKSTGQFQDFIGTAQPLVFALKGLDAFTLIAGNAFAGTGINLAFFDPFVQGLGYAADLADMDSMAAYREGYSPRCSCTIRTARSRTSGENFVDFLMAPSSQVLEPPQNPGRFSLIGNNDA